MEPEVEEKEKEEEDEEERGSTWGRIVKEFAESRSRKGGTSEEIRCFLR